MHPIALQQNVWICQLFCISSFFLCAKMELCSQTAHTGVLNFWLQQELQATPLHKDFSPMGPCMGTFLSLMMLEAPAGRLLLPKNWSLGIAHTGSGWIPLQTLPFSKILVVALRVALILLQDSPANGLALPGPKCRPRKNCCII